MRLALLIATTILAMAALPLERAPSESRPSIVPFRSPRGFFFIVVHVYLNGTGPYDSLLDTGSTCTAIDEDLSRSLGIRPLSTGTITTVAGPSQVSIAFAESIRVGSLTVPHIEVALRDLAGLLRLDAKIQGVLGQNVLSQADYLLEFATHTVQFDLSGELLAALSGDRVRASNLPAGSTRTRPSPSRSP